MRLGLGWVILLSLSFLARASQLPLTAKEIGLMLRAGYSSRSVMQELEMRRFGDTFDPEKESLLLKAGATRELIDALERGKYLITGQEAAHVQEQMANAADRKATEAERSRKVDSLYQSQLARERTKPLHLAGPNVIYNAVKGDLVRFSKGGVVHADDDSLADKKLIAIYFSAHWCPPCRKFTPELVEYYNRVSPQHPEFEVLFFSVDRSAFAMQTYMRETNMPWPAIDYQKLENKDAIRKYAGSGIPCLVLVDSTGKVISDSFAGKEYLGPGKVLADLDSIFAKGGVDHVATTQ
jgi:nucleoredoxin